jgi:DNA repair protein RecO (recombination protein O)
VTQAETVEAFLALRKDLILTGHASYILELVDRFTYIDETDNSSIFKLVLESLNRLAAKSNPWLVLRFYELRLLDLLGFRPLLFECANCRQAILAEDQYFSPSAGGVICPRCGKGLSHLTTITMAGLKFLRHLQRSSFQVASRANPNASAQQETEAIMHGYLNYLLERSLKTPEFLSKIRTLY